SPSRSNGANAFTTSASGDCAMAGAANAAHTATALPRTALLPGRSLPIAEHEVEDLLEAIDVEHLHARDEVLLELEHLGSVALRQDHAREAEVLRREHPLPPAPRRQPPAHTSARG